MKTLEATHGISLTEFTRTSGAHRQQSLVRVLSNEASSRKVISFLCFSLREVGGKNFSGQLPTLQVSTVTLKDLRTRCREIFMVKNIQAPDKFENCPEEKESKEALKQFSIAKCKLDEQIPKK